MIDNIMLSFRSYDLPDRMVIINEKIWLSELVEHESSTELSFLD